MNILVTGGAGYIGSHTLVELIEAGHTVHVVDNLSNSSKVAIQRVEEISKSSIPLHVFDLMDKKQLSDLFSQHHFDAVLHFAGLKAVGESVKTPLAYYRNNLLSTITLLEVMDDFNIRRLIFSSSAVVYGSAPVPYIEQSPTGVGITNPYGQTKYMIEQILRDTAHANPSNIFTTLRYFNPAGAHPSGRIGEDPRGTPNNLMPYITQVATGRLKELSIFGDDYDTIDGTCVRDYIHVVDLAKGHVAALSYTQPGLSMFNLGTGKGTSVLELVHAFEKASGKTLPYKIVDRSDGDLAGYYANADKSLLELHWKTEKTIEDICADSWRWQSANPRGYDS